MQISHPDFDGLLEKHFADIYRLSFLLTALPADAWQATFQTFLYLGAQTESFLDEKTEQDALYGFCIRTCTDYYYRKIRRRPRRERFEKLVPFAVSDRLWALMGLPFHKKAALFLTCYLDLPSIQAAHILQSHAKTGGNPAGCEAAQWRDTIASIRPAADGASQMSSQIYLRFEERNVPLENRLRRIRLWLDQAVIWIAVAIVLLFAATAYYTAGLSG